MPKIKSDASNDTSAHVFWVRSDEQVSSEHPPARIIVSLSEDRQSLYLDFPGGALAYDGDTGELHLHLQRDDGDLPEDPDAVVARGTLYIAQAEGTPPRFRAKVLPEYAGSGPFVPASTLKEQLDEFIRSEGGRRALRGGRRPLRGRAGAEQWLAEDAAIEAAAEPAVDLGAGTLQNWKPTVTVDGETLICPHQTYGHESEAAAERCAADMVRKHRSASEQRTPNRA
jgi:hypothetical protein